MPPVFSLTDHYDTTVTILGRDLPVKIKRYSRAESDAMYEKTISFEPRGAAESEQEKAKRRAETTAFFEQIVTDGVSLDEDVFVDRGVSLTTGAQLLDVFRNRQDVLADLARAVIIENRMMPSLAKNSRSLRATDTGSARSSEAPSERSSERTATSAVPSSSATRSVAAGRKKTAAAKRASSGASGAVMAPG